MRGSTREMSEIEAATPSSPTEVQRLTREENERARLCALVPRFGGQAHLKLRQVQSERAGDWKTPHYINCVE